MEVYYERQMRHNYLIIKQENSCEESYESQMLMANTIDGLLKFRFRQTTSTCARPSRSATVTHRRSKATTPT